MKSYDVLVPPKISNQQKKMIVRRGERAKIWCETVGIPTPKLEWSRDNVTVSKGEGGNNWGIGFA
jgi:hypothetical protein